MATATDRISREDRGDTLLIRARGKLDQPAAEELIKAGESARGPVVVVLKDVVYISSTGVAALVQLTSRSALKLAGAPENVRGVLELAGVASFFHFYEDEAAALAEDEPK